MAFTLSQPSYGQAGTYTALQDRFLVNANVATAGVRNLPAAIAGTSAMQGDLAVTANVTPASTVSIAAGDVWVNGGTGQGFYYAYNDAAINSSAFASNASGNPRIDLVVVQVTDTGAAAPSVAIALVQGTAAASPSPPATPAKALALAQVRIPNGFVSGTTAVLAANITDVRPKAQLWNLSVPATSAITTPTVGNVVHDGALWNLRSYNSLALLGTSVTSLSIGTGARSFTTQANLTFAAGQRVRAISSAGLQLYAAGTTTSVTSLLIGTGSKTLTVGLNLAYVVGTRVRIFQTTTPANFMEGAVTAYTAATGSLTVNVDVVGGSGTIAAWTVSSIVAYMEGAVTSYSGTTLAVSMDTTNGAGTFTDWLLYGPAWEQPVKAVSSGSYDNTFRYAPTTIAPSTVTPTVPVDGALWYQNDTKRLSQYDGSWQVLSWTGAAGRIGWRGRRVAAQSIPATTLTDISWDTEDFDSNGFLTPTSATLTIPAGMGGLYSLSASIIWASNPTAANTAVGLWVQWTIGGVAQVTYTEGLNGNVIVIAPNYHQGITATKLLAPGDTAVVRVYQRSAGAVNLTGFAEFFRLAL